jgi:hypothetical protein
MSIRGVVKATGWPAPTADEARARARRLNETARQQRADEDTEHAALQRHVKEMNDEGRRLAPTASSARRQGRKGERKGIDAAEIYRQRRERTEAGRP